MKCAPAHHLRLHQLNDVSVLPYNHRKGSRGLQWFQQIFEGNVASIHGEHAGFVQHQNHSLVQGEGL